MRIRLRFLDGRLRMGCYLTPASRRQLTQRPDYLFADLIGARSVRTSNFIFPSVSPGASVLVRGIRSWNRLPLAIKNFRSVAAFERAVMERMRTNFT
jgi:hypothetical protein